MKLQTGPNTIRKNVATLVQSVRSPARKKAIITISKKHNISRDDAKFKQAISIAKSQARK